MGNFVPLLLFKKRNKKIELVMTLDINLIIGVLLSVLISAFTTFAMMRTSLAVLETKLEALNKRIDSEIDRRLLLVEENHVSLKEILSENTSAIRELKAMIQHTQR